MNERASDRDRKPRPSPHGADEHDETRERERAATPDDFENDPARNPQDETLKDLKGG